MPIFRHNGRLLEVQSNVCRPSILPSNKFKNIFNTIVHSVIYDILLSLILCRMHLYAQRSQFNVRDKYVTSSGRLIVMPLANCDVTENLPHAYAGISRSQPSDACLTHLVMRYIVIPVDVWPVASCFTVVIQIWKWVQLQASLWRRHDVHSWCMQFACHSPRLPSMRPFILHKCRSSCFNFVQGEWFYTA